MSDKTELRSLLEEVANEFEARCAFGWADRVRSALAAPAASAVPQPLPEERIIAATDHISMEEPGVFVRVARAVEMAHGIGVIATDEGKR